MKFYLTGSRLFGGARATSDYDYFVEASEETEELLSSMGFKRVANSYRDSQTVLVMRHPAGIHVQLIGNIEEKLKAQEYLLAMLKKGFLMPTNKLARKLLWNNIFSTLKGKSDENNPN